MNASKTILVVDDNADILAVVSTILEKKGYDVECASNGPELFQLLEENKPALILLDIMLPQVDGLELLRQLKEDPKTSSIPVILLTAKGQYRDVLLGYKLGTDYYISKPFTGAQLINGVNLVLGNGHH